MPLHHTKPSLTDQDLHAFVDGELDGRRYRQVVAQLAADLEAAERVNSFLRQRAELAMLRESFDLRDLGATPNRGIDTLVRQLVQTIRHRRRARAGLAGSGIAACLLVGIWTTWGPNPREVAEHLSWRSAFDDGPQVLFGRDPFASTQLVMGESEGGPILWLDEQLAAYSVRRPDLASYGLRFIGGNALHGGETPAIRLVYEDDDGQRVFLFVGTVGSDADVALTLVPEGHISLNWRRGPLVFALIGPKDSEQLRDVMKTSGEFLAPSPDLLPPAETAGLPDLPSEPTLADGSTGVATAPVVSAEPTLDAEATAVPLKRVPAAVPENTAKSL